MKFISSKIAATCTPKIVRHGPVPESKFARSPLIYAGNKGREAQRIASLGPDDWSDWAWCEPFVGSAGLFLNAPQCARYSLSDINSDVIGVLRYVRDNDSEFFSTLKRLFVPGNNTAERYAEIRREFNEMASSAAKAATYVFLNRSCFNGVNRYNKAGQFNTSWGRRKKLHRPDAELRALQSRLQSPKVTVSAGDFRGVLDAVQCRSVVVLDPPYLPASDGTGGFVGYSASGFGMEQHEELASRARKLARDGHYVIAMNNDSPVARKLHSAAAEIHVWPAYRRVAAVSSARGHVLEQAAVYRPRRLHATPR